MHPFPVLFVVTLTAIAGQSAGAVEQIDFLCSWEHTAPITVSIFPQTKIAIRSDGGSPYTLLKITKWGVWLAVDSYDDSAASMAIQTIERGEFIRTNGKTEDDAYGAGAWTDVIVPIGGSMSSIEGGECWEQKPRN